MTKQKQLDSESTQCILECSISPGSPAYITCDIKRTFPATLIGYLLEFGNGFSIFNTSFHPTKTLAEKY